MSQSLTNLTISESYYYSYSELFVLGRYFIGGCKTWTTGTFGDLYFLSQTMKVKSISLLTLDGATHSLPYQARAHIISCNSTMLPDKSTALSDMIGVVSGGSDKSLLQIKCGNHAWSSRICDHKKVAVCADCDNPCNENISYPLIYNSCGTLQSNASSTMIRHLVVAFTPPKPAPKFSATVTNYTSTTVTLLVELENMDDRGEVTCGYFPVGQTLTGSFMIYMQRGSNLFMDKSNRGSFYFKNLVPSTSYKIYCVTVSTDNVELGLQDILLRAVTQKTQCCKLVSVSWAYLSLSESSFSGGAPNVVKVEVNSLPENFVSLSFHVINPVSDLKFPLVPPTLTYLGNGSLTAVQYLSIGFDAMSSAFSSGASRLILSVQAKGISKSDYALVLTAPDVLVLTANQEPPTPQLLTVVFSPQGTSLLVTFDSDTNLGGIKDSSFDCSKLFAFVRANSAVCQWNDLLSVTATLGSSGSIQPGDSFQLLGGNIKAKCTLTSPSKCSSWNSTNQLTTSVLVPLQVLAPIVTISAPSVISKCDRLKIDISGSQNSGGRSWKSHDITVTDTKNVSALEASSKATAYFNTYFSVSPPMQLTSGVLEVSLYKIVVTLTNFLGGVGSASTSVLVVSKAVPVVSILGASLRSITRQNQLSLLSTAATTECMAGGGTVTSTSNLQFTWSISSNDTPLPTIESSTKVQSAYRLLPYTLDAGKLYTVKLTVLYTVGLTSSSASVQLYVDQSSLVASVSGGSSRGMFPGQTLTLDGSTSRDENLSPYEVPTFSYSWDCMTLTPALSFNCGLSLTSLGSAVVIRAPSDADTSVSPSYRVRLTVFDDVRSSYTDVTVTVLDFGQPTVTIATSFTSRFNPDQVLRVKGVITAVPLEDAACTWTAKSRSGNDIDMTTIALTPLAKTVPASQSEDFMLAIYQNTLPVGLTVVLTLTCKRSVATVLVEVNGPPRSGSFSINPSSGTEFDTTFVFSGSQWFDEDLPLTYSFTFGVSRLTIKPVGESSYTESSLSAGDQSSGFQQVCYLNVYDSLLLGTEVSKTVVVKRLNASPSELNDKLSDALDSSISSTDPSVLRSFLSVASSMLNFVDCSRAPNCTSLYRSTCQSTPSTCGSCLPKYIGASGDSNTPCVSSSRRRLLTSTYPSKACTSSCSNHGTCKFIDLNTNVVVQSCTVVQSSCDAICFCNDGYYGNSCSMDATDLLAKQAMREKLLTGDAASDPDLDTVSVTMSMSSLTSITRQIDEISFDSAKLAVNRALSLLDIGTQVKLLPSSAKSLFSSLVKMTTIDSPQVAASRRLLYSNYKTTAQVEKLDLHTFGRELSSELQSDSSTAALQSAASTKFERLILQSMVSGQASIDVVEGAVRFTSGVPVPTLNGSGMALVTMSTPLTLSESIEGVKPFKLQLSAANNGDDIKLGVGIISKLGYGSLGSNFLSNPMTLLVDDMSVCNSRSGCKVQITMQNNVAMNYVGQNVNVSSLQQRTTICNGTFSSHVYPCQGSTDSIKLNVTAVCQSKWKGNITSTCPYIKSYPSCKMLVPSSLLSGTVQTISDPCTLKSFTATSTTCECRLSSQYSRRRLSSSGNDFQFTQTSQTTTVQVSAQFVTQADPTTSPTFAPSYRPTPSETVTLDVTQKITGLDVSDFSSPDLLSKNGRVIALAVVMSINNATGWSLVEYDVQLKSVGAARRLNSYRSLLQSSVSVNYLVTAYASGQSSSQIISTVSSVLTTAANSGTFATNIQSAYTSISGTTSFTHYNGGTLTVGSPLVVVAVVYTKSPTPSPTSQTAAGTSSSVESTVIIATIIVTLGFVSIALTYYYYLKQKKKMGSHHTVTETSPDDVHIEVLSASKDHFDDVVPNRSHTMVDDVSNDDFVVPNVSHTMVDDASNDDHDHVLPSISHTMVDNVSNSDHDHVVPNRSHTMVDDVSNDDYVVPNISHTMVDDASNDDHDHVVSNDSLTGERFWS